MADDTTKKIGNMTASTKGAADAADALAQGADGVAEAIRRMGTDVRPATEHLKNFEARMREANKEQLTWAKLMATSRDALRKYKDEMFGAEASMRKLTGSITRMGDTIKSNIKLMDAWKGQVDIIRKGQSDLSKATYLHTGDIGKANAALQKSIDGVRQSNENAQAASRRYREELEPLKKVFAEVKTRFEGQLQASDNYKKSLSSLQDKIYLVSKSMGVDASKAMDYMQSRMETGGKTLDAVQQETILVAKATDAYVASMRKIPDVAKSAYMSQGMLLEQLKKVGDAMGPLVDKEVWAGLLTNLSKAGTAAGMPAREIAKMQDSTIKFMEDMQRADLQGAGGLWAFQAAREAQNSGLIEDLKKTGDAQTKRRMATLEKILASDQPEIKKTQATIAALKGETRFQKMAMEKYTTPGSRAVHLQQMEDKGFDPLAAQVALDAMGKGGAIYESLDKGAKTQKDGLAKSEEANAYLSKMQELTVARQTPEALRDEAILKTATELEFIKDWLKVSLVAQFGKLAVNLAVLGVQTKVLWNLRSQDAIRNRLLRQQLSVLRRSGGGGGGGFDDSVRPTRTGRMPKPGAPGAKRGLLRRIGGRALGVLGLGSAALGATGMLPPGADAALDVGETALDVAGSAKPGAAAAKGGAGAAKSAGWLSKAGRGAGWAARAGGKRALGLLGPHGLVASAGLAGYAIGTYADKKLGMSKKIGNTLHDMDPQTLAMKMKLAEAERTTEDRVGAKIIGGQGIDSLQVESLKGIKNTEARARALVETIRKASGTWGQESHRKDFDKVLHDIARGGQTEFEAGNVGSILDAQLNTLKLRQKLADAGLSEEDLRKQTGGTSGLLGDYIAKMRAQGGQTGQLLPEQSISALRESRQQQISMSMDSQPSGQTGEAQEGKFNSINGSMTYTTPGSTMSISLAPFNAALKTTQSIT